MSCAEHCSVFPRARANAGDAWRLEATLRRLESGRCLQVAVIGEAPQQLPCMQAETYAERFVGLWTTCTVSMSLSASQLTSESRNWKEHMRVCASPGA